MIFMGIGIWSWHINTENIVWDKCRKFYEDNNWYNQSKTMHKEALCICIYNQIIVFGRFKNVLQNNSTVTQRWSDLKDWFAKWFLVFCFGFHTWILISLCFSTLSSRLISLEPIPFKLNSEHGGNCHPNCATQVCSLRNPAICLFSNARFGVPSPRLGWSPQGESILLWQLWQFFSEATRHVPWERWQQVDPSGCTYCKC